MCPFFLLDYMVREKDGFEPHKHHPPAAAQSTARPRVCFSKQSRCFPEEYGGLPAPAPTPAGNMVCSGAC